MSRITKKTAIRFLKYNVGGFLYFAGAWVIITFGTSKIGLWWANVLGNMVGITLNYVVQRFWAFGARSMNESILNWRFAVLTAVNLVISYWILKGLVVWGVALWFAQFISAGFFMGWNWMWYNYWVFKKAAN